MAKKKPSPPTPPDWQSMPVGRPKYQAYLASREWAVLKQAVKKRSGGVCERCKDAPCEETHHVTYDRCYKERLEDLLGVCRSCHAFVSGYSDVDPVKRGIKSILPDRLTCPYAQCGSKTVYINQVACRQDSRFTIVLEMYCDKDHWWELKIDSNSGITRLWQAEHPIVKKGTE